MRNKGAGVPVPVGKNLEAGGEEDEDADAAGDVDEDGEAIEVFKKGDVIGEGCIVNDELVRAVPSSSPSLSSTPATPMPGHYGMSGASAGTKPRYEVMRKLGTGSYGFVYLVREVLSRTPPSDDGGHCAAVGKLDFEDGYFGHQLRSSTEYGREYAIKVLSKANLDEEALAAQLFEVCHRCR